MEDVEGQNTVQQNEVVEGQQNEVEKMQEMLSKLQSQNERLLNESKSHAEKYRKLRDSVEGKEKAELEKAENWKELVEREKQEKFEVQEQLKDIRKKALRQSLNYEVAKHAQDAKKLDRVISAVLDSDMVKVSDDMTSFDGVQEAIEYLRNEESFLFNDPKPASTVNKLPSNEAPKGKTINEMSKEEKDMMFKESIKSLLK